MFRIPPSLTWGCLFAGFYLLGAATTPQWADASKLTLYALAGHLPSLNPGDHPGWTALAWIWVHLLPWDPVRACHGLSALLGACSVGLLVELLRQRGAPAQVLRGAALLWGLAHAPWWAAELTESYTLAFTLSLATLLAAEKKRPFCTGLFAGWAAATHALSLFLTAGSLLERGKPSQRLAGLGLGTAPLWLALLLPPGPDPLTGHLSGGAASLLWHWEAFFSLPRVARGAGLSLGLLAFNLGPLGLWALRSRGWKLSPFPWHLLALALFLASYAPFRLHLMVGFLVLALILLRPPSWAWPQALAHLLLQAVLYFGTPWLITQLGFAHLGVRQLPGRNNAWYFLNPLKVKEKSAWHYSSWLLDSAPPGAVVVADFNPGAILKLQQQTARKRPDLKILPTAVDEALANAQPAQALGQILAFWLAQGRPVLLADRYEPYYRLPELTKLGFQLSPCGPGMLVQRGEWRADRDSNPEPSDP